MKYVEFTLESGNLAGFFITNNVVVTETNISGICRVCDGIHNNGGWAVRGSFKEVVNKIRTAGVAHREC